MSAMVMRTIHVALPDELASKLADVARREFRRPADQAAVILRDALDRPEVGEATRRATDERRPVSRK